MIEAPTPSVTPLLLAGGRIDFRGVWSPAGSTGVPGPKR